MNQHSQPVSATKRIESIDVLRGLTILVMIFVNDLAGVSGVPAWMKHISPSSANGMTFVDVVFPAFLFIVGMSIPFALGRRLESGDSMGKVVQHLLTRTLGLLIIGVFMVNSDGISDRCFLNPDVWILLMYIGVILVWNTYSRFDPAKKSFVQGLRITGVIVLVIAAILFRGRGNPSLIELRPQWWGILGLIGWAYLTAGIAYLWLRNNPAGLVGVTSLLYCVFVADRAGFFSRLTWITDWVDIGSMLGSLAAVSLSGVILGFILTPKSPVPTHSLRIRWALGYGLGLAAAGILLYSLHDIHEMFIINKNAATPPWCLLSSAVTVGIWIIIYWLIDIKGWKRWAIIVGPAGQNPLFAYILAPILYSIFTLSTNLLGNYDFYGQWGSSFGIGFWRSVIFALGTTWLAGGLRNIGIQLKL